VYLKYQLCLDRENPFSPGTESGESVFLYLRAAAHDPPSRVTGLLNTTVRPPKLVRYAVITFFNRGPSHILTIWKSFEEVDIVDE
jgi:hypothetical protein